MSMNVAKPCSVLNRGQHVEWDAVCLIPLLPGADRAVRAVFMNMVGPFSVDLQKQHVSLSTPGQWFALSLYNATEDDLLEAPWE